MNNLSRFLRALVCVISLLTFGARAAEITKSQTDLAKQIVGAWQAVSMADGSALPEGFDGQIKFIGDKHWTVVRINPDTKKLDYTLGGTYTLKGDEYVESIEYASEQAADMIGQKVTFKLKIEGDKLTQIGQGNPYSQVLKRAT